MPFIDINKLTSIEDCDRMILLLIQEGYKKYLDGTKDGERYLANAIKIMDHSFKIKNNQERKNRLKNKKQKEKKENE